MMESKDVQLQGKAEPDIVAWWFATYNVEFVAATVESLPSRVGKTWVLLLGTGSAVRHSVAQGDAASWLQQSVFLLLLHLYKTSAAVQSVHWARSTLLISAVMSTAQWRNRGLKQGEAELSRRGPTGQLRWATIANTQKKVQEMTVNWASSNFTPQVKQAMNLGQIFNRKSISRNTTHNQSLHLIQSESRCRGCAYKIKKNENNPEKRKKTTTYWEPKDY